MEINWIENTKNMVFCKREVRISTMTSNGRKYTTIAFYGNSQHKITDGLTLKVGMTNERIYFAPANERGFKISKGSNQMFYIRIPGWKTNFCGEHDLIFDAETKLWFVSASPEQKG